MTALPDTTLALHSMVTPEGELEIGLARLPMPEPRSDEVLIRVLATPINPSDVGPMIGVGDIGSARASMRDGLPVVKADIPPALMSGLKDRVGQAMAVGNEGSGVVVSAGASAEAQALVGKTVAAMGGGMYAEYRCLPVSQCMVLPDGTEARDAASCFVNPLTALSFVETARREGYAAIVHAAAASALGQMLVRICAADGIPLINIVRSPEQVALLEGIGAQYVLNSTSPDFFADLVKALTETRATIAFDPIGGGPLADTILAAMEAAALASSGAASGYGSGVFKQVYIYGRLDRGPRIFSRYYGYDWAVSGYLLHPQLSKFGPETVERMKARVASEIKTTFASHYSHELSLIEVVRPEVVQAANNKKTGEKYLIRP